MQINIRPWWFSLLLLAGISSCTQEKTLELRKNSHITLVGNNLASRMMEFGWFETEMQVRYPDSALVIRNLADPGDTPGFRPRSGTNDPWVFPGAEDFQEEYATPSGSIGFLEKPDQWLTRIQADIVVGFFGFNESFQGLEKLQNYKDELEAWILHTQKQKYNGNAAPQIALVSPIAFEDISDLIDVPDGKKENTILKQYTEGMREIAQKYELVFVDAFDASQDWYNSSDEPLTIDGTQLTEEGYKIFGDFLADKLFGQANHQVEANLDMIHAAVQEKNWMWHNDYKIPNGVHVFGRRYDPFGPDNYPFEQEKIRQMTAIRDSAIWDANQGKTFDLATADARTRTLPEVTTNYNPEANGSMEYLYGEDALKTIKVPEGYKIELFASEQEFPDLANPVQLSFDNKGRLWVATMPSYPHYKPGDPRPQDKLIILEDTDGDGKADKQTTFADNLHIPVGFEIAADGVYVSQSPNLVFLEDTDGDDKADKRTILLSGFDDHDTHHAISAFTTDESGAIFMGEGVFLHTNVETSYGPVRATNGGFYRYEPKRHKLERVNQVSIPNPWGIAFDEWGQNFYAETSGPNVNWMLPGSTLPRYGNANYKGPNLVEKAHLVRPTSGLEFISSRHFPDDIQGDLIINNTIGFLGTKQHQMVEDTVGFTSKWRQDLITSTDRNFRPVDMEIAPDGSLYVVDWHNILIGHMQHNARDPLRDHVHGRIYRVTYPSRPLITPAKIDGASIYDLLENLKLPEYRTRYRTKRELRGRDTQEVYDAVEKWLTELNPDDPNYEHNRLEALWVTWGADKVNQDLLRQLLKSDDYRVRAAATRVLRYTGHQVKDQAELLMQSVKDPNGRVRIEAIAAASWLPREIGTPILAEAEKQEKDNTWIPRTLETAVAHMNGLSVSQKKEEDIKSSLTGSDRELFVIGKEIYAREGFCATCHQEDGGGLAASGFPPLKDTPWVTGSPERAIKIVLKGLLGPIEVAGKEYPGQVPMTPFEGMLDDSEVAAVLTFVRNSFGNQASPISPDMVKKIRAEIKDHEGFYNPSDLLKQHPMEK
ncbi:PVC-type heme-binding CxxCH protein [Algoriphagus zhangzhouensis]|uniref:Putative membrane-bound dehydrogenase domain-containing protein n=1 Tax=Algoriphagus zhangzhouensis TaxID=1073327 RepID=A0A1M7ZEI8_9BACT|nr:PVC-type heme-binding CxxCH protein [Algoriphagus zhangzhouensis]TDY46046.1 putative membrane-bound dehydrogenase-like protein [Algoriphagus zhangzhouensis]SHO63284.1 putative membrane-bound dehydrogenase domain-containing protein [Algoriphagus zhangzhouensis]